MKSDNNRNMKSKLNIIIVIWFLSMFFSGFAQERIVPPRGSEPIEFYKKKVLESGDVDAYKDLYFALHRKGRVHEYFIYSLFMANKYIRKKYINNQSND